MTDKKFDDLNEATVLDGADLFVVDTNLAVTPETRYVTYSGLVNNLSSSLGLNNLSADSPRVYTSSDTWTKPANLVCVIVEAVGGGGGGGGVTAASSQACLGQGGGGGGYRKGLIFEASLSSTETITVGTGGAGGSVGTGSNGGNSSFGSHITANGGSGGNGQTSSASVPRMGQTAGGGGGTGGSGGDIAIAGGPGIPGIILSLTQAQPSMGGASHMSPLTRSTSSVGTDEDGITGAAYGGGGSGAQSTNDSSNHNGGAGADGVVIVWEFVSS